MDVYFMHEYQATRRSNRVLYKYYNQNECVIRYHNYFEIALQYHRYDGCGQ